jgi:hypothetical protein
VWWAGGCAVSEPAATFFLKKVTSLLFFSLQPATVQALKKTKGLEANPRRQNGTSILTAKRAGSHQA